MPETKLSYCKLCELEDFGDPDLRAVMRDMAGPVGPPYPEGEEHRKHWEVAMTARALRDFGALREDAEILGVGAGTEATIFWLTRHVRRVFATDLYFTEDAWSENDSGAGMLVAPEKETGHDFNPRRLVVQHMNGLELRYEDESFDGIFSSGSIEHFGDLDDIRRSAEEMHRVLKPGGVLGLATEYRLAGDPPGLPGTVMFDESELRSVLLEGLDWKLASPLDLSISQKTLDTTIDWWSLFEGGKPAADPPTLRQHVRTALTPPRWRKPNAPEGSRQLPHRYPHLVLRADGYLFTSVHLALIRPGADPR